MFSLLFGRRKGTRNSSKSTRRRGLKHRRGAGRRKSIMVGTERGRMVMTHKGWRVQPEAKKRAGKRRSGLRAVTPSGRRAGRPRGAKSLRRTTRRRGLRHARRHTRRRSILARMLGLGKSSFGSFGSGRNDSLMQAMGPFPSA